MSPGGRHKLKRVFVNGVEIGRAKNWHDAEEELWQFAELLFEHIYKYANELRDVDKNAMRQAAFLNAMGIADPTYWKTYVDREEIGDMFRFSFKPLSSMEQS